MVVVVPGSNALRNARAAFAGRRWKDAYEGFVTADGTTPLDPDDLDRVATAAYLIGDDEASVQTRTRAHAGYLARGDAIAAARSAIWLASTMFDKPGQRAQASGWLARNPRRDRSLLLPEGRRAPFGVESGPRP